MNDLVISLAPVRATRSEIRSPALANKWPQATWQPVGSSLGYLHNL